MPRYIYHAASLDVRTIGGAVQQELWLGIDTGDVPVNLEFMSRHGYHLVPAHDFTEDELRSVGVTSFDPLFVEENL